MSGVRWFAAALLLTALLVALLFAPVMGGLLFGLGVVVMGIGALKDRPIGTVLIIAGLAAVAGIAAHLITGVMP